MIVKKEYKTRADGVKLVRRDSDENRKLIQNETGNVYVPPVIDVENAPYTYSESAEVIEPKEMTAEEALALILGGE